LVLVTIAAIGCVVIPPLVHLLFPPTPKTDFDELIDLITSTIDTKGGGDFDTSLTLTLGGGQEIHEQTTISDSAGRLGGGGF
jgi:hypothetical protein